MEPETKMDWKNLNRLLSNKSLDKLLEYLDGELDESGLATYLTSSNDEVKSLKQLTALNYEDQQFFIYQQYMRTQLELWVWVIQIVKFVKAGLIFMLKQFMQAGYETFPVVYCPGNRIVEYNVTLISTCLRVTFDWFRTQSSSEKVPDEFKSKYDECFSSIRELLPKFDGNIANELEFYLRRHGHILS